MPKLDEDLFSIDWVSERDATVEKDCHPPLRTNRLPSNKSLEDGVLLLRVAALEDRFDELKQLLKDGCVRTYIETFAPQGVVIIKPIPVSIVCDDGVFIATFFDGNVNASGDTSLDAFESLKGTLLATFRFFCKREGELGREPKRQLAVLRDFMREP